MWPAAVRMAFRESGIVVRENFGSIEFFEKTPNGVRMTFSKNGNRENAEATLAVVAVGWVADTAGLNLAAVGVEADHRTQSEPQPLGERDGCSAA